MQFALPARDITGTLLMELRAGETTHWLSADGAALILEQGLLSGTRGFGEGLLASDTTQSARLVRAQVSGRADRFHTYLTGDDTARTRSFRCDVTRGEVRAVDLAGGPVATVLMREACNNAELSFTNLYWVNPRSGEIVLSRQWVGPYLGAISLRTVTR
jgi:hypothetical protein